MAGGKISKVRKHSTMQRAASHSYYKGGEISLNKADGQHILINNHILDDIVAKSGIKSTDIILEIGPGTGQLTQKLLEVGKRVIAIEKDPRMISMLDKRFRGTPLGDRLQVINSDVLKCELPYFDICVSNTPYQISSPLTFMLLEHQLKFRCAVLMFQEEFAMRLCAKPGDKNYSRLTVNVQRQAYVSHLMKVGKKCFRPPPKVNSSVVRIEPKKKATGISFEEWDGFVRICFNRKNKTLGSIFRQKSIISLLEHNYKTFLMLHDGDVEEVDNGDARSDFKGKVLSVLEGGDFEEKRAIKLNEDDFLNLLSCFNKAGIHFA
ncbi:18S rRNA (adenine(1779)-N(6)/adenine(1780)-N(6))-dimethyltransferase [Ranunculus cassubicifolius]